MGRTSNLRQRSWSWGTWIRPSSGDEPSPRCKRSKSHGAGCFQRHRPNMGRPHLEPRLGLRRTYAREPDRGARLECPVCFVRQLLHLLGRPARKLMQVPRAKYRSEHTRLPCSVLPRAKTKMSLGHDPAWPCSSSFLLPRPN
jgi:hypothetical protein